ncbi:hypothetical protein SLEP1_g46394 [Rubroshorea leprosula]|uniref:ABC transporter ATP-binding protein n=1 Tax=Rubroshorea leprosula TaxID=152421 RepID=A0AAV5LNM8_9ROSI|nr:hypothetical protein SLEP1_g46394 [Rubroshorea leprosula]
MKKPLVFEVQEFASIFGGQVSFSSLGMVSTANIRCE